MRVRNNLRLLRDNRGISLRRLGAEAQLPFGLVSEAEHGRYLFTDEKLERLCLALGVTTDMIYPDPELRKALSE